MKLVIIDGQSGRMGALLTERVKAAGLPLETLVVGTNAIATAAMMKALAKSKLEKALQDNDYAQGSYAAEMEQAALLAEAKANRKQ